MSVTQKNEKIPANLLIIKPSLYSQYYDKCVTSGGILLPGLASGQHRNVAAVASLGLLLSIRPVWESNPRSPVPIATSLTTTLTVWFLVEETSNIDDSRNKENTDAADADRRRKLTRMKVVRSSESERVKSMSIGQKALVS